jgi:hypothetical protein
MANMKQNGSAEYEQQQKKKIEHERIGSRHIHQMCFINFFPLCLVLCNFKYLQCHEFRRMHENFFVLSCGLSAKAFFVHQELNMCGLCSESFYQTQYKFHPLLNDINLRIMSIHDQLSTY